MTGSGIDLRRLNHRAFDPVTRVFAFPDGLERLITLDRRHWEAYDELDATWGFEGDYEKASYEWSLEEFPYGTEPFETKIRDWFLVMIQTGWTLYNHERWGKVNDNGGP